MTLILSLSLFIHGVGTSSEVQKSRVFQGCFTVSSRATEAKNENNVHNELFKTFLNVKIVDVITVKQQCALSVSFQY